MPTMERDIVLQGRDSAGNPTIDMPVTRIENVECGGKFRWQYNAETDSLDVVINGTDRGVSISSDGEIVERHEHQFTEDWEKDEANHWHECEWCYNKQGIEPHVYASDDSAVCTVCGHEREMEYDAHTLLLLHGDSIEDSSMYQIPIENTDVVASSENSKFGGKSLKFNGTTAYLRLLSGNFNIGTKDFTVDWWEYITGQAGTRFALSVSGGCGGLCGGEAKDENKLYIGSTGTSCDLVSAGTAFNTEKNKWVHTAIVRKGTSIKSYKNGILIFESTISDVKPIFWNDGGILVGSYLYNADYFLKGYIDEFRVSDVARWTENFTPPTKPYPVKFPKEM